MAVFAVMGIAYSFAGQMKTNKIFGAACALMSWFLIMPYSIAGNVTVGSKTILATLSGIPLGWGWCKGYLRRYHYCIFKRTYLCLGRR